MRNEDKIATQVREAMDTMFANFVAEAMTDLKPDGGERVLTTTVKVTPDHKGAPYCVELTMRETIESQGYDRVVYRTELRGYF